MLMIRNLLLVITLVSALFSEAVAQSAASPYSVFGIGIVSNKALIYNQNMGGLGISNGQPWVLNNINPAMLPLNTFSTFDAGLFTEKRDISTSDSKQSSTTGGLSYLTFGFPIKTYKWTMAIGLMPYSNVSYNVVTSQTLVNHPETTVNYNYEGDGGLNQAYLSSGWMLVKNLLYAGGRVAYTFGKITDNTRIALNEIEYQNAADTIGSYKTFEPTRYYRQSSYSDFILEGGLYARKKIGKATLMNLGFIYEFGANLNTHRTETIEVDDEQDPDRPISTILDNAEGQTTLPAKFGYGLSFTKDFHWTIGVDYYTRDWTKFSSDFGAEQELAKSRELILGGEFTPDFTSVKSYFKRVNYQVGFSYNQTPILINNQNIDDFGINFGVSLPVGNASLFNLGFKFGQQGTTSDGLIKENYLKLNLGMTFNDRSFAWYRSLRKFD
jgi:hypothetical protein